MWTAAALTLLAVAAALVFWARTRPSYDAYGWLVWGYQTLHLSLDLGGAPSWKPLPYLFTVPYAVFGTHLELRLWMITAVSLALAGCGFAARIAFFVVARDRGGRAPWLAAGFAAATVLGLQDYLHYVLSVQSDPLIVTFTLAGIDAHLRGRPARAFWFGVLAGLGRPEAWCLLGPYTIYLWLRVPRLRLMVASGWALVAFMWFGVPTITNGRPFVSAQLAMGSPRELRGDRVAGTLHRFWDLYNVPFWVVTVATLGWAARRRDRLVLGLGGGVALWVLTEIAFALHGWPGLPRYMFEPAAICGVISAIGVGELVAAPLHLGGRSVRAAGPALAAAILIALLPYARIRFEQEHDDLRLERARTAAIDGLSTTFARLGGVAALRRCGQPVIDVEWASALAYSMHLDVGFVGYRPAWERRRAHNPIVVFTALADGWRVRAYRSGRHPRGTCRGLNAAVLFGPRHPAGRVVRV